MPIVDFVMAAQGRDELGVITVGHVLHHRVETRTVWTVSHLVRLIVFRSSQDTFVPASTNQVTDIRFVIRLDGES